MNSFTGIIFFRAFARRNMGKKPFLVCAMMVASFVAIGQIEGDVADTSGKGIANAVIVATDTTNVTDSVMTDSRGFYEFKKLKKGKYSIEVKAAGFITGLYEKAEVTKESSNTNTGRKDISSALRLDFILAPVTVPINSCAR
jgi:hypothetical protein